jgi:hypothetical protein
MNQVHGNTPRRRLLFLLCVPALIFALTFAGNAAAQSWNLQELLTEAKALTASRLPSLRDRAQAGEARAQFLLGLAFEYGYASLTKDPVEALRWFRKAADQGIGLPEAWVGDFYQYGIAGTKDFPEALRWYRRSVEHGYAPAAPLIAQMYVFGDGVAADHREAAKWFRRAVELGNLASKESATLFDSPCHDDFCVALRQLVHAALTKRLSRYRGQPKTDPLRLRKNLKGGTKILPGSKDCTFDEADFGSKEAPIYTCTNQVNPVGPQMTERFHNLVQRVKAALPPDWAGTVQKDSHGWLRFDANPLISEEERKELDARDWIGWYPLVEVRLSGASILGEPFADVTVKVHLNR